MDIKLNEIYTLKLITGDEIVTKIVQQSTEYYIIDKPLTVIPGPKGIQLLASLFTADPTKNMQLNKNACAIIGEVHDDVSDIYIQATTGIVPLSRKILTG